jgi:hypothetical protein|tara:strand:+ start:1559 stop:1972 length:414 start_codon:yes stop_codon:yes gene_type:complete
MEDTNFALLVIGFFIGYIIKSFTTFRSGWSASAHLVRRVADQCLKLLGTIVYRVSFMDQLYQRSIALTLDSEIAKVKHNELNDEFDDWKKETIELFMEEYPEDYKWQLEFFDWKSAMRVLSDIYNEDRYKEFENDKK